MRGSSPDKPSKSNFQNKPLLKNHLKVYFQSWPLLNLQGWPNSSAGIPSPGACFPQLTMMIEFPKKPNIFKRIYPLRIQSAPSGNELESPKSPFYKLLWNSSSYPSFWKSSPPDQEGRQQRRSSPSQQASPASARRRRLPGQDCRTRGGWTSPWS